MTTSIELNYVSSRRQSKFDIVAILDIQRNNSKVQLKQQSNQAAQTEIHWMILAEAHEKFVRDYIQMKIERTLHFVRYVKFSLTKDDWGYAHAICLQENLMWKEGNFVLAC